MLTKMKGFVCFIIFLLICLQSTFAVAPVLDVANLMNAVEQLYATYDQINSMIEQALNTYELLKIQIEAFQNIDWEKFLTPYGEGNWSENENDIIRAWEWIGDFRNNLKDSVKIINDNTSRILDIGRTVFDTKYSFCGKSYSFKDILGFGEDDKTFANFAYNSWDYVCNSMGNFVKSFTENLPQAKKEEIVSRWGMPVDDYMTLCAIQDLVDKHLKNGIVKGSREYVNNEIDSMVKANNAISSMLTECGQSVNAKIDVTTETLKLLNSSINQFRFHMDEYVANEYLKQMSDNLKEEAIKNQQYLKSNQAKIDCDIKTNLICQWM